MARLVHLGGAVMDYVYRVNRLPEPGDDITATSCARLPGGAVNMMVAARRTGLAVACGGYLGTGPDGDALRAFLADEGIEVLLPPLEGIDSGNSVVLITPDAERSFVSWPGAETRARNLDALQPLLRDGDILAISGYVLALPDSREAILALLDSLDDGIRIIFDPAPVIADVPQDAITHILARTTWMSANRRELAVITGNDSTPEAAQRLLAQRMPRAESIIVRDGANGACLVAADGRIAPVAGFAVDTVDTNGAGDTHLGAFVSALSRGMTPPDALRYANAAAALSTTRHGGASGPTHDEVEEFLSRHGSGLVE